MEINSKDGSLVLYDTMVGSGETVIRKVIKESELKPYSGSQNKKIKKLKVKKVTVSKNEDVYDITVIDNRNFFANKTLVHNCVEIGFIPQTKDGRFGVQFCNLTEINGAKVNSIDEWKAATEAATIIGTLQAGYTSFPYLSSAAEELTKEEALLGVSITGWFDNPKLLFDEQNQYMMSKLSVKINEGWAKKININKAARITCTKPSGTASIFLGSSSGIHPHHAHKYFRRVQVNKQDNVAQFFKMYNPHAVEESVWSSIKSDNVITFPLSIREDAIVKDQLTAIEHLNYIRKAQENWVLPGGENNQKDVTHNISCTVEVSENEWEDVIEYLYKNKQYFAAVALLPKVGDKLYRQAPLQRVYEEDELKWNELISNWEKMDFTKLEENEDQTALMETVACGPQGCDITMIPADKKE